MRKSQTTTINIFLLLHFYIEKILLENIFGKTSFKVLHLHYSFQRLARYRK